MSKELFSCSHLNERKITNTMKIRVNSHRSSLTPARPLAYQILRDGRAGELMSPLRIERIALRNRRARDRLDSADRRCAGRKRRCRNKFAIALPRWRTIGVCGGGGTPGTSGKSIAVGIRSCVG